MDAWTTGADIATMVTGLSVVTAAYVWTRAQMRAWREQRAAKAARNWDGYIEVGGINSWYVRLAEEPTEASARVALEVVDRAGKPDENWAQNMRQHVLGDGMLARPPTPEEYDFQTALRKDRGYGQGGYIAGSSPTLCSAPGGAFGRGGGCDDSEPLRHRCGRLRDDEAVLYRAWIAHTTVHQPRCGETCEARQVLSDALDSIPNCWARSSRAERAWPARDKDDARNRSTSFHKLTTCQTTYRIGSPIWQRFLN